MKCAFLGAKIAAFVETAKRNLLKSVKGFEKVRPFPAPLPDIQQISLLMHSVWISGTVFPHFGRFPCRISTQTIVQCIFLGYPVVVSL